MPKDPSERTPPKHAVVQWAAVKAKPRPQTIHWSLSIGAVSNNQQNIPLLEPEAKSTLGYVVHYWDNRHIRHWSLSPLKNYNSQWQAMWAIDVELHYVACSVNYSWFFLSINNIYKYGWVSIFDSGPSASIVCQDRDRFCLRVPDCAPAPAQHHYWQGANIHGTSWFLQSSALPKNHLANKKQSTNLFFCRRSKISKWEFKESRIIPLARAMRLFPLLMLHHFQPPLLLRSCTDSASHGYSHYAPRTCVTEDGCCVATRKAWIPLICRLQPLRKFLQKRLIINRPDVTNYKVNRE